MTERIDFVPVEIFAAKSSDGIFIAVPPHCGLKEANILRVEGLHMMAMKDDVVLPIDFPAIPQKAREHLLTMHGLGKKLPVAEFRPRGLMDAYELEIVIS